MEYYQTFSDSLIVLVLLKIINYKNNYKKQKPKNSYKQHRENRAKWKQNVHTYAAAAAQQTVKTTLIASFDFTAHCRIWVSGERMRTFQSFCTSSLSNRSRHMHECGMEPLQLAFKC